MRARLIGGLPADLVGLAHRADAGPLPRPRQGPLRRRHRRRGDRQEADEEGPERRRSRSTSSSTRRGINVFAKAGSPVIAVQDGKIVKMGRTDRLGKFIQLRDVYGNTYTYGHLKKLSLAYPVPKEKTVSDDAGQEGAAPAAPPKDPKPTAPASAGTQVKPKRAGRREPAAAPRPPTARRRCRAEVRKERLFANPSRPAAYSAGGEEQLLNAGSVIPGYTTFKSLLHAVYGLKRSDVVPQAAQAGQQGHRRDDPGAHRAHRAEDGAAHALRGPPRRPRRAADRPEADPRRLEAAGVDGDLPRRRQEPVLGPRLQEPVDRADPA